MAPASCPSRHRCTVEPARGSPWRPSFTVRFATGLFNPLVPLLVPDFTSLELNWIGAHFCHSREFLADLLAMGGLAVRFATCDSDCSFGLMIACV